MKGNRLFMIACCGLGLMALSQVLVASLALAVRFEEGRQVRIIEREVEKIVPIRINVPAPPIPATAIPLPAPAPSEPPPTMIPTQIEIPAIADPRAELLVEVGRKARVAGDMGMAILKFEEALTQSPSDPTVLFEMGMVHEAMGLYGKAADFYEKVFQLGVSGAGELYEAAAVKLRDGFEQPADMLGKLALGRVRIFNDKKAEGGQRVVLTVPIQKAPGEEIDAQELQPEVTFFNKNGKGEIVQVQDASWAKHEWVSLPFDWSGGEETVRLNYQIPDRDKTTEHLFGMLSYYGQVVTLKYKGEVLDVQAWPRELAARIGQATRPGDFPEFLTEDMLPPDFDPDIPLLNPIQDE